MEILKKLDQILTHITYMDNTMDKKNPKSVIIQVNYLKRLLNDLKYKSIPINIFKKVFSICVKCVGSEWCKAYDSTDLSLNDCNDFVDSENFIDLLNFD